MSYLINNQQKVNEIIFARRNKAYGAYVIRSTYGNTIFKSLSIMLFGFGALMAAAFYLSNRNMGPSENNHQILIHDSTTVTIFDLKKDEDKPAERIEKKKEEQAASKKEEDGKVIVTDSVKTESNIVLNADAKATTPSTGVGNPEIPSGNGGEGGEKKSGGEGGDGGVKQIYGVDSGPEYEGGLPALYKFVSSHLKYPSMAAEMGKEGTVYVKFVVDEKGKVGNLSLLNNTGFGLDEEAVRVVSMIPNFKTPAKVKGEAVKVYYQLPIKFRYK